MPVCFLVDRRLYASLPTVIPRALIPRLDAVSESVWVSVCCEVAERGVRRRGRAGCDGVRVGEGGQGGGVEGAAGLERAWGESEGAEDGGGEGEGVRGGAGEECGGVEGSVECVMECLLDIGRL